MTIKIISKLLIDGKPYQYSHRDIKTSLTQPGRASFSVISDTPLKGVVSYKIGYAGGSLVDFFSGYVENCESVNNGKQEILARHFTATLSKIVPISIRHASLTKVLEAITEQTGLVFKVLPGPHLEHITPGFYSVGSGLHCLDNLGQVFGIQNYFWTQTPTGAVLLGNYLETKQAANVVPLPKGFIQNIQSTQQGTTPPVPNLQAGAIIAGRGIVKTVQLVNNQMVITWSRQFKT
jgi:hypothetical protein